MIGTRHAPRRLVLLAPTTDAHAVHAHLLCRRSAIFFAFSCNSPGIFDVTVMYRSRHIAKISLQLDDLLEKQHMGQLEFETDFLKLNVNLLIYLLNRDFVS